MTTNRGITRLLSGVGTLVLLLAVFTFPAYGQTNKGTIKGTVTDQNGGIVQNATVTVTNTGTNAERTVTTGDDGTYEVPLLDPGTYKVVVKAPTFSETTQENVVVQTSSTAVADIKVTAGQVGGTVTVTSEPSQVQSE